MIATDFDLKALDGYELRATHFAPSEAERGSRPTQCIVIGNATATPRGYYRRFATWCAEQGVDAVVTDYRGIGDAKHGSLKGFEMEYADWTRYDLAAAVAWARARVGGQQVWLVGHSLGGHALGQLPDLSAVRAAFVCGTGAGWHGWMPRAERWKVWALWNVIGPIVTRVKGFQPMSSFGMGEDIPMGVYRDWGYWCGFPHYFFDAPDARSQAIAKGFDEVRFPVAAMVATDDLWAQPKSRDAFFSGFRHASVDHIDRTPAELGGACGHFGYFRPHIGPALWPQIMKWLSAHGLQLA